MSREESPRPPDDRDSLLIDYHEALLASTDESPSLPEPPGPGQESAFRCLQLLEQHRRALARHPFADIPGAICDADIAIEGSRFGRYEILRELGRGGHGVVYRAWDPVLQRDVALKIPRPETVASAELYERFRRESEIVARLSHPNLCALYELGQFGPACYIASQFCSGPNLATWLRSQTSPLELRPAAELTATLADTLHYVHEHGVLHRDVKPANVLLEFPPAGAASPPSIGRTSLEFIPKLTDFGLARVWDGTPDATATGTIAGTPAYMAPEQASGRSHIGPQTDVYALGVLLYELLTGRTPFQGASDLDTLRRIDEGTVVSPRRLRPDVPRDLESICLKCLEYEPRHRYCTAGELAGDLRRFLSNEPVHARQIGPAIRLAKWSRRKPLVAALSLALALTVMSGFGAITWQWRRAEGQARLALESRRRAEENLRQAHRAVEEFHAVLYERGEYDAVELQPLRRELLQTALKYYRRFLAAGDLAGALQPDIADAHYHLAFISATLDERPEAIRLYRQSIPIWQALIRQHPAHADYRYHLLKTHRNLGLLLHDADRFQEAFASYHAAIACGERLVLREPGRLEFQNELAVAYYGLGSLQLSTDAGDEALASLKKSARCRDALLQQAPGVIEYRLRDGEVYAKFARIQSRLGHAAEAKASSARACRILGELVARNEALPESLEALAGVRYLQGSLHAQEQLDLEAEKSWLAARDAYQRLTERDPGEFTYRVGLVRALQQLAKLFAKQEQTHAALQVFEEAHAHQRELVRQSPDAPDHARDLAALNYRIARFYYNSQKTQQALQLLDEARALDARWQFNAPAWRKYRRKISTLHEQIVRHGTEAESSRSES